ncbi:MAG: DNA cytosine methyltransferase [Aestuariivirga sp.]
MNYYNEFDPYAAQWLKNLIAEGLIPDGFVDERSIKDVPADFLKGFSQCHFFAGIGGWSLALRLAGWPDDRPAWTGSCPCQPYSAAGSQKGFEDERDLWPVWFNLIAEVEPSVVFGEQVSAAIGQHWLDRVRVDLERSGYALGAAVLPACAVGAPHKRDRLWFVAHPEPARREGSLHGSRIVAGEAQQRQAVETQRPGEGSCVVEDADSGRQRGSGLRPEQPGRTEVVGASEICDVADALRAGRTERRAIAGNRQIAGSSSDDVADADVEGLQRREFHPKCEDQLSTWQAGVEWVIGADGKARRVKSGLRLLAHGVPARVGKLRAFGNAIVPQLAAEFIAAYAEYRP